MKRIILALAAAVMACSMPANAFKLSDLLAGLSGNTVTDFIEGVFSTSDITVADMAGEWTVDGSAVAFQSENFLKKAGGVAAATAAKEKLDPYFKKYGMTGGVFTIETDGTFSFQMKRMTVHGTVVKEQDGNFTFHFTALGSLNIGSMTAYVQKTSQSLDIMFDASQLKSIMNIAAKFTGSKLASAAVSILNSYDGMCVGFRTHRTGNAKSQQQNGESGTTTVGGFLNGLFGGNAGTSSSTTATDSKRSGKTATSKTPTAASEGGNKNTGNGKGNSGNNTTGGSMSLEDLLRLLGGGSGK